jgi:hypothetical protein
MAKCVCFIPKRWISNELGFDRVLSSVTKQGTFRPFHINCSFWASLVISSLTMQQRLDDILFMSLWRRSEFVLNELELGLCITQTNSILHQPTS